MALVVNQMMIILESYRPKEFVLVLLGSISSLHRQTLFFIALCLLYFVVTVLFFVFVFVFYNLKVQDQWRKEVTADVVEITRELELEMKPEDVTELLKSHDRTLLERSCFLWMSREKWFLEMGFYVFTPGEDAVRIVERTTKDLDNT